MTLHGDLKAVLTFLMQFNERISSKDFYFIGQQFFCLFVNIFGNVHFNFYRYFRRKSKFSLKN